MMKAVNFMSVLPEILASNERYAASFGKGDLPAPPGRHVAILTCMDARLDPAKFLGLEEGDAHVIRNAGGRADEDALRSLIISQQLLGTNEVVVIHHVDCGMLSFTNDTLRGLLAERFGSSADEIDFLPFSDLVQSVRDDIATIRNSPFIPNDVSVSGFIYDVHTGKLEAVN
jgi:carbonic anhydrase